MLADPTLSPEEARAFDAAGIEPRARHRWVAAGFSAEEARAWTDLDVVASEDRVALAAVRARRRTGAARIEHGWSAPAGFEGGWAAIGPDRDDMSFGVVDPPGTRGRAAESFDPMWDVPEG